MSWALQSRSQRPRRTRPRARSTRPAGGGFLPTAQCGCGFYAAKLVSGCLRAHERGPQRNFHILLSRGDPRGLE
eukprot:UN3543